MNTTRSQPKQIGTGDLQENQLCFLMYEGAHYHRRAEYRELVQNAQHRCQQCGRTAKQDKNLCTPVAL